MAKSKEEYPIPVDMRTISPKMKEKSRRVWATMSDEQKSIATWLYRCGTTTSYPTDEKILLIMVEKEILKQRILELEKENESLKKQLKEMKDHRSFIEGKENFKHISENGEFVSDWRDTGEMGG